MCIVSRCIKLETKIIHRDRDFLCIKILNTCNHDVLVSLRIYFIDGGTHLLHTTSINIEALKENYTEIMLTRANKILITGDWMVKGTMLKLPINEIVMHIK